MNTTKTKAELRKRGEALLKAHKERVDKQLRERGIKTPAYETATAAEKRSHVSLPERRSSLAVESRGTMKALVGSAVVYDTWSCDLGGFRETVRPGAFNASLAAKRDVQCLKDHNPEWLLGRTSSGSLTLADSRSSLDFRCVLPDTQIGRDTQFLVERRDISACSFGFYLIEDDWDDAGTDGLMRRTLISADIFDVSCVANPAYAATSCSVRSKSQTREADAAAWIVHYKQIGRPVPAELELRLAVARLRNVQAEDRGESW